MSESRRSVWNVLALALQACVYICLGLWILLLSTICSSPLVPDADGSYHFLQLPWHLSFYFADPVTDRRKGAGDDRLNGATFRWLKRHPRGLKNGQVLGCWQAWT